MKPVLILLPAVFCVAWYALQVNKREHSIAVLSECLRAGSLSSGECAATFASSLSPGSSMASAARMFMCIGIIILIIAGAHSIGQLYSIATKIENCAVDAAHLTTSPKDEAT